MCMSAPARSVSMHARQAERLRFAMILTGCRRSALFLFPCLYRCPIASGPGRLRPATSTGCCPMIALSGRRLRPASTPLAPASLTCQIQLRHFYQTGQKAGLHEQDMESIFSNLAARMEGAIAEAAALAGAAGVPESTAGPILAGVSKRARTIDTRK